MLFSKKLFKYKRSNIEKNSRMSEGMPENKKPFSDLSMNILREGDKSPAQRGFFKISAGDLLPALRFLGGLCNFCNYTFFNHNGM